jgi:hypothetical protein
LKYTRFVLLVGEGDDTDELHHLPLAANRAGCVGEGQNASPLPGEEMRKRTSETSFFITNLRSKRSLHAFPEKVNLEDILPTAVVEIKAGGISDPVVSAVSIDSIEALEILG